MKKFIINTDGASRGNPGHASSAYVIQTSDGVVWVQDGKYLGIATNNEAEYTAVKLALDRLIQDFSSYMPAQVEVRADSELIVRQLNGLYKIKSPKLKLIASEIFKLIKDIGQVNFVHVPRSKNFLADKVANQVLDRKLAN